MDKDDEVRVIIRVVPEWIVHFAAGAASVSGVGRTVSLRVRITPVAARM